MKTRLSLPLALVVSALFAQDAPPAPGEKHALLVGVQEYSGSGLSNLKFCDEDVHGLAATLVQIGYTTNNITVLSRRAAKEKDKDMLRPTAVNIRKWLDSLCDDARPEDSVLIALSGHGVQLKADDRMYFCPLDCNIDNPSTLISIDELYENLDKKCKAAVKLLLVDACRNDPVNGKGPQGDERLASVTRPQLPDPPGGIAAFFSCSKGQRAFESDNLKHGVFFNCVIEGLCGKASNTEGEVTVSSLEDYLTRVVPRIVKHDLNNPDLKQVPERRGALRGTVVLSNCATDTIAMFACSKGQTSFESNELHHGFFFDAVIRGLESEARDPRTKDATWPSLATYVLSEVQRKVVVSQTPEIIGRFSAQTSIKKITIDWNSTGNRYALLVGVDSYYGTMLNNLRYAEREISDLGDTLRGANFEYKVTLLTRAEARKNEDFEKREKLLPTSVNIRVQIKSILQAAKADDTVLIALSGQGVQKNGKMYFCPSECDLEKSDSLLAMEDIFSELKKCRAVTKVLLVDASHDNGR